MSFDKFAWLDALLTSDATDGARLVGVRLALKHENNGRAWPSYQRLAEDLHRSTRAVRRATEELRALGFLDWTSGNGAGHSNRYRFLDPPKVDSSVHDKGGQQRPPSDEKGGQQRHERWTPASQKVDASVHRTNQEPSREPSIPDEVAEKELRGVLAGRLDGLWIQLQGDPQKHRDKLDAALTRAVALNVDPEMLAEHVMGTTFDGVEWIAANVAYRVDQFAPQLEGTRQDDGFRGPRIEHGAPANCRDCGQSSLDHDDRAHRDVVEGRAVA